MERTDKGAGIGKERFTLTGLAILALVFMLGLSLVVRDNVRLLGVAQGDQIAWRAAQVEVEYLKLLVVLRNEVEAEDPDLPEVRKRFDLLYSRLPLFSGENLTPEAQTNLASLQRMLDDHIALIDGQDEQLVAGLPDFERTLLEQAHLSRSIALGAIREETEKQALQRKRIVSLLEVMMIVIVLSTLAMALTIFFLQKRTQSMRRASIAAEEKQRQLRATLDGALGGIVVADGMGRVIDFNTGAEEIFGYNKRQAFGKFVIELLFPPAERETVEQSLKKYQETGRKTFADGGVHEFCMMRADGSTFPAQAQITTAQMSTGPIFISFFRDISSEKQHEADLTKARDAALSAVKERSRFFAMMSHEMRTPLNGVLSSLYLMEESPLTAEQKTHLNTALFSGDVLMSHINDVLAIERSEDGQGMETEACDVHALVSNMIAMLDPMAKSMNVELDLQCKGIAGRHFMTVPRSLQQILINLLSNAIKFSPEGAVSLFVSYMASGDEAGQNRLRFEVSDTGIGIAPEDQARIFEDFVSLDDRYERRTGGTGLGLGIVRRFVDRLGGSLRCESEIGEGATFILDLPIQETDLVVRDAKDELSLHGAAHAEEKHILVVDDNQINRDLMVKMLAMSGHRSDTADGGEAAIRAALDQPFDLILMDISMPGINGTQASRAIRGQEGPNRDTPIVAFTAHALPDEQDAFREAGMSGYLLKPVSRRALIDCLQKEYRSGPEAFDKSAEAAPERVLNPEQVADLQALFEHDDLSRHVEEFWQNASALKDDLERAAARGNLDETQSAAHTFSGISGMMGALRLQHLLRDIEQACKLGQTDRLGQVMLNLAPACEAAQTAWQQVLYDK